MPNPLLLLRALTALHPGAGTSIGAIDQPVQREKATGWPLVQGSTVKGVLRDGARQVVMERQSSRYPTASAADTHPDVQAIFGPADNPDYGGALSPTDARLLAFPVRSACNVFCWVTCIRALNRLRDDFTLAGLSVPTFLSGTLPVIARGSAAVPPDAVSEMLTAFSSEPAALYLVLEDLILQQASGSAADTLASEFAAWLETNVCGTALAPKTRCAVLSDDAFTHLVRYATEIATRIRLDPVTKQVKKQALFTVELLPPETLMYSVLMIDAPHGGNFNLTQESIIGRLRSQVDDTQIQIGGEETTGKGWCRARLYPPPAPGRA